MIFELSMTTFASYIGIDCSGAQTPSTRLPRLRAHMSIALKASPRSLLLS